MSHDEKLRKKAFINLARKFGIAQDAEDIYQEDCLRRLDGYTQGQTAKQAFIDYLRRGKTWESIQSSIQDTQAVAKEHGGECAQDIDTILGDLDTYQRVSLILKCLYGFTCEEIGFIVGLSKPSISRIIKEAQEEIRRRFPE